MKIGVNLFGPKCKLYHDFNGTLERLIQAGVNAAEPCVIFAGSAEPPKELNLTFTEQQLLEMSGGIWSLDVAPERIAALRAKGIAVDSVHVFGNNSGPKELEALLPMIKQFGADNEIKCFVISLMKDRAGIQSFIPVVRRFTEELAKAGILFAYHNHEIEWEEQNGRSAMEELLDACPLLKLELDVGWAKFAGKDPVAVMKKYANRIVLLHFKDITEDACKENRDKCFTAVGEGSIPLAEIMACRDQCALVEPGLIIDQDDSLTDIVDDIAIGAQNVRRCAGQENC